MKLYSRTCASERSAEHTRARLEKLFRRYFPEATVEKKLYADKVVPGSVVHAMYKVNGLPECIPEQLIYDLLYN